MTFDDGILIIYRNENTAANGEMPVHTEVKKGEYFFGFDYLGFNRYFEALKAQVQLDHVVNVPEWIDIRNTDSVQLEDGIMYRPAQIQRTYDDGLKITKISLERIQNDV